MIEAKNINKTYYPGTRKAQTVLENASLTLPDKGLVTIVGQSGSGKSTILNAIGGLISYDGQILYDGHEVEIEKYRRENIGFVFQDFLLFDNLSIRDNIRIALNLGGIYNEKEISRRVDILLKSVGLKVNSTRSANALSLGQRQRVGIARALANNPRLILADEPTGNLDSKNSARIMDILKELSKDRLVVVVTHNMHIVSRYADEAYIIKERKFEPFDPKRDTGVEESSENEIQLNNLEKKTVECGNVLLTIYSDPNSPKSEATLIERNGQILLVGDNIAIAHKDEVNLIEKEKTEAAPTEEEEKTNLSAKALDFSKKKTKKTFKQSSFARSFRGDSPLKYQGTKGTRFYHIAEIVLPLIAFFILNIVFFTRQETQNSIRVYSHEENAVLIADEQTEDETEEKQPLSYPEMLEFAADEESHILNTPYYLPIYSSTHYQRMENYPHFKGLTLPPFAIEDTMGRTSLDSYNEGSSSVFTDTEGYVLDIEKYKPYSDALRGIELEEDEILLDRSFYLNFLYNHGDIGSEYYNVDVSLDPTGMKFRFYPYCNAASYTEPKTFTVKGMVEGGFFGIYVNTEVAQKYMLSYATNYGRYLDNRDPYIRGTSKPLGSCQFPSLEGVTFADYDNVKDDSSYSFQEPSDSLTLDNLSINDETLPPFAYLSNAERQDWNLSTRDSGYLFFGKEMTPTGNNRSYGLLSYEGCSVTKDGDSSQKVIVLRSLPYKESTVYSYDEFYRFLLLNKLESAVIDESLPEEDGKFVLSLPSGLVDAFPDVSFALQENEFSPIWQYTEDFLNLITFQNTYEGSIDDPIHISKNTYNLLLQHYSDTGESFYASDSLSTSQYSDVTICYLDPNMIFLSEDTQATIQYLNEKLSGTGMIAYSLAEARKIAAREITAPTISPFFYALLVILLMFLLFAVLDSVGKINSLRYQIGVLRCLGMKKSAIVKEETYLTLSSVPRRILLPLFIALILLVATNLFALGWYTLLFLLIYCLLILLATLIPLWILLAKKPADILRSLN